MCASSRVRLRGWPRRLYGARIDLRPQPDSPRIWEAQEGAAEGRRGIRHAEVASILTSCGTRAERI